MSYAYYVKEYEDYDGFCWAVVSRYAKGENGVDLVSIIKHSTNNVKKLVSMHLYNTKCEAEAVCDELNKYYKAFGCGKQ